MALSEDQRALLGLLLAGDTYERVADVVGTSADEVRRRAHEAANELEAQDEPEFPPGAVRERLAALEGAPAPEAAGGSEAPQRGDRRARLPRSPRRRHRRGPARRKPLVGVGHPCASPDAIVVRAGKPVRLKFRREETASCSDKVIFADFNKSADLPTGETVAVELLPKLRILTLERR